MDEAKRTAIARWLLKAESDIRTARVMLNVDPPATDIVCFHAQQCAEKALKAFLVAHDTHVARTHDLGRLVTVCSEIEPSFTELESSALVLSGYAVASRYPDDWREIPVEEAAAPTGRVADPQARFACGGLPTPGQRLSPD